MIDWNNILKNNKNLIKKNWKRFLLIGLIICILFFYYLIIINNYHKKKYTENIIDIAKKNENTIFSIDKIYVCSSANATESANLQNKGMFDIYQYTDMAIFIDNYQKEKGLTNENTVKQLYIDNIDIQVNESNGKQCLKYTNVKKMGSKEVFKDFKKTDRIDFNIIYTNEENEKADYNNPTFYTDCSNPISLKYANDLGKNYSIDEGKKVKFDGSLLKDARIPIEEIKCNLKFKINLINNNDEYFSCWINTGIPLNEIYEGTSIKSKTTTGPTYNLFKS